MKKILVAALLVAGLVVAATMNVKIDVSPASAHACGTNSSDC